MRVIRPAGLNTGRRAATILVPLGVMGPGVAGLVLALAIGGRAVGATGVLAAVAALGLGIGAALLLRVVGPNRRRSAAELLQELLAPAFDDDYALVLAPPLPIRGARELDGLLVGPAGIRVLTVRDWDGRYRVRGRGWEFDAGRRRGWIPCRTNPSLEVLRIHEGVVRWADEANLHNLPIRGAVAFPLRQSRIVLEEPDEEVVTTENVRWWANAIGRARRLDPAAGDAFVNAVLDAGDAAAPRAVRSPAAGQS